MNKKAAILVTGGAGYIGSVVTTKLSVFGYKPIIFDKKPQKQWPRSLTVFSGVCGDIRSKSDLAGAFKKHKPIAVIHLAAATSIRDSMNDPYTCYDTNVIGGLRLLEQMRYFRCKYIIFSSSAAVLGEQNTETNEKFFPRPTSAYGETKRILEGALSYWSIKFGMHYCVLRYFNVSGATLDGKLGENFSSDSKLIPSLMRVYLGKQDALELFGTDYKTQDGTAVRDYVHIEDVSEATTHSLQYLLSIKKNNTFHVGSGRTHSNKNVIEEFEAIVGQKIPLIEKAQRVGDIERSSTSIAKITRVLRWKPRHSSLKTILKTSLHWYKNI